MASQITCPSCGFGFALEEGLSNELKQSMEKEKQELRKQMLDYKKQKDDEAKRREEEYSRQKQQQEEGFQQRMNVEVKRINEEIEYKLRKTITADYDNQLKILQRSAADYEEKLKASRKKELEFLQKEQQLKFKEEELELELQKKLLNERGRIQDEIRKMEEQKNEQKETEFKMRLAEYEKKMKDQQHLIDEMKRKAEQGSMQLQGEVQELMLENILHHSFPYDKIIPVGKGVKGADCIQTICNPFGNECGRIIYESKRTASFGADWIEKLKADMRSQGADLAVIVTQTLPKDMERFGEREGVYICTFAEVRSLAHVLRLSIIKTFAITQSQENKGDKMHLLYSYLTSAEFSGQWNAIREGFMTMRMSIQKERDTMEKLWKAREKQLEKVLLNAAHIKGSIEGIAGSDVVDMNLLEDGEEEF